MFRKIFILALLAPLTLPLLAGCGPSQQVLDSAAADFENNGNRAIATLRAHHPDYVPLWYVDGLYPSVSVETEGHFWSGYNVSGSFSIRSTYLNYFLFALSVLAIIVGSVAAKDKTTDYWKTWAIGFFSTFGIAILNWLLLLLLGLILSLGSNAIYESLWAGWTFCLSLMCLPAEALIAGAAIVQVKKRQEAKLALEHAQQSRLQAAETARECEKKSLAEKQEQEQRALAQARARETQAQAQAASAIRERELAKGN